MKNNEIKLNRFYQLVSKDQNIYSDEFSSILDSIVKAKENKEISETDFNFLLKLLMIRKIKEESKDIMKWQGVTSGVNNETTSLLINISSKEKQYA